MNRKFIRVAIIWNSHPKRLNASVCLTLLYCASLFTPVLSLIFSNMDTLASYSCFYRISVWGWSSSNCLCDSRTSVNLIYQQVCKSYLAYWDWSARGVFPLLNVTNVNLTNQICCCHKSDGQLLVSFHDANVLDRKSALGHCWVTVEMMTDWSLCLRHF